MTEGKKRIKDPIYGYIEIEDKIFDTIIDTPEFQRIKDVIQTSYSSLYPSTLHNRFVHSLGVYRLGCMVADAVLNNSEVAYKSIIESYRNTFEIACLLHDVGHAPFSHTGEFFYLKNGNRDSLHNELVVLTDDESLGKTIRDKGYKAAPHEIMSAIIGIRIFGSEIPQSHYSFFARCITGYMYEDNQENSGILNCFIELLNSKVLDVDKIDYLIRDAYMSGFDSSSIDYERLLGGISIKEADGKYLVCYSKAALSVVENVVYAHDLEKKWIQSHPTVLYEAYLVKKVFEEIIEHHFAEYRYLPGEILSQEGIEIKGYGRIRLASDSDMLYLMKNLKKSPKIVGEYFDRRKRKHPIWKTEAEFQAIFAGQMDTLKELNKVLKGIDSIQRTGGIVINVETLERINQEINYYQALSEKEDAEDDTKQEYLESLAIKKQQRKLLEIFKDFSENKGIEFNYLVLYTGQFDSGFRKTEFENMMFDLPILNGVSRLGDVSNVLKQDRAKGDEFFYIYYKEDVNNTLIGFSDLITALISYAGGLWNESNAESVGNRVKQ